MVGPRLRPALTFEWCAFPQGLGTRSWGLTKYGQIARFIEPTEYLPGGKIPEGDLWTYELKLDFFFGA